MNVMSMNVRLQVGQMGAASIGMPPEELGEMFPSTVDDQIYSLEIQDESTTGTMFTGYSLGPSGSIRQGSVNTGWSFIHTARDLETYGMWLPHVYNMGPDDFRFQIESTTNEDNRLTTIVDALDINKGLHDNIIDLIKSIAAGNLVFITGAGRFVIEDFLDSSYLSQSISRISNFISSSLFSPSSCTLDTNLVPDNVKEAQQSNFKRSGRDLLQNTIGGKISVWQFMQTFFSMFYATVSCTHDGRLAVVPIYSGCRPPGSNHIPADLIDSISWGSQRARNVSAAIVSSTSSAATRTEGQGRAAVGGYAIAREPDGAVILADLPPWLNIYSADTEGTKERVLPQISDLAKSALYAARNANRMANITIPLAPNLTPGTTVSFDVTSGIRALSGKTLPFSGRFYGFCHQVDHNCNFSEGQAPSTTIHLSNIFTQDEEGDLLERPPLFTSDNKPFPIQS